LPKLPVDGAYHLWGGKRISEEWDGKNRKLMLTVQGPAGVQDTLVVGCGNQGIKELAVNGKQEPFFFDAAQGLVHGKVTFTSRPLKIEVLCSPNSANALSESPIVAAPLASIVAGRAEEKP